ncbi:MAG TPA: dienelactone hydrolase family protein [Steroidobacteraceae bacterium]
MIEFKRPDGRSVAGYLSEPASNADAPGVVVIQEWWGLNEQIKAVADRLARAGYRALVPDLYRGQLALDENEAEHLMNDLDFADAASQDICGAARFLKASGNARVGVTGFCMGGALVLLALVNVPDIDVGVVWYGCPALEYVDASRIKAPLMGHWAIHDTVFPITLVDGLEQKLRAAAVPFEFHRYDAKHAFANETADSKHLSYLQYNPTAAATAWHRTMGFLARHLQGEPRRA